LKREAKLKVIVIVIVAVLCMVYFFVNCNSKSSVEDNYIEFFKQMISVENYKLLKDGNYEELADNFRLYCNERGLNVVMSNREIKYNYNFIEKHNIKSYRNLFVELIEESTDGETYFKKYKISYNYIDSNNKEYEMADYYQLNIKDNMIDYVKIDSERSTVGSN
jgi:hypothetical protein